MSQVSRLENDHMRLGWDARKRRLIAVYVADEIFFLHQSPGKLSFPFALRCTRTCHTLGLTPVSRLHIGGGGVVGVLFLAYFLDLKLTGPLFDPLHCPRFPIFLSWHICS